MRLYVSSTLLEMTQVIHPSPEPAGMTSFLAVSLPPDSCPDKTGEFLSVPIGSRKVRLETDWKITGIVRKHPTGIRRQRTSRKRLGNGRKRRKPAGSDTEIAGTGRLFEVPATGLIDLGIYSLQNVFFQILRLKSASYPSRRTDGFPLISEGNF